MVRIRIQCYSSPRQVVMSIIFHFNSILLIELEIVHSFLMNLNSFLVVIVINSLENHLTVIFKKIGTDNIL